MNRSVFALAIAFILALFALPSLTFAQTPVAPASLPAPAKDTVLFNFEAGTYDGWTLSGDCWDKQPATKTTFAGVSGIGGAYYLSTMHPKLGKATTGKAVSRDFPIDKPFLTFRIGGGYYPKEACVNLLIDGKIVRTETGNDSAELRPASWDVSLLLGKKAHIEIVDATTSAQRGYIMVDDIIGIWKVGISNNLMRSIPFNDFLNVSRSPRSRSFNATMRLPKPAETRRSPTNAK